MAPPLKKADLEQFTGTFHTYRHSLMRHVVYTDGVKYVAEAGGAYWLIDKIATLQLDPKVAKEDFQVWQLKVSESAGDLTCDDGNGNVVHRERIGFTDFTLDEIRFFYCNRTIMLPSEY